MYTILSNTRLIDFAKTLLISGFALICGSAEACDEEAAMAAGKSGDYELVFEILKPCESDPQASASVLFALAYFYYDDDFHSDHSEEARRRRLALSWDLSERAALTGDEDAIMNLASMFRHGDKELGFGPETDIADCLYDATSKESPKISEGRFDPAVVDACLNLPPNDVDE